MAKSGVTSGWDRQRSIRPLAAPLFAREGVGPGQPEHALGC